MKYHYPIILLFLLANVVIAQDNCAPKQGATKAFLPDALQSQGFEVVMSKGPFLLAQNGRYSYLRVQSFSSIYLVWDETLALAMKKLRRSEGLILDIRNSSGEDISLAYRLAGCFISDKKPGHYSYDEMGKKSKTHVLRPHPKVEVYEAPVIVLTNRKTCQAAEITALVLNQFPQVTMVGTPTAGTLTQGPDGRQHRSVSRVSLGDRGVPVDVAVTSPNMVLPNAINIIRGGFIPKSVAKRTMLK